jgi:predicted N-acetyltransferase YhbS
MTTITYQLNQPITTDQFRELLRQSTLGERRPIHDDDCLTGMINNSNLVITAWDGDTLVGIARSLTDFHYACYLSDLAVHQAYQKQGIGQELQRLTQAQLGPHCTLILLAAPLADSYYGHIGYERHPRCWILPRHATIQTP